MGANLRPQVSTRTPLLRALHDGSAGAVTRLLVSFAGGLLLFALGTAITYVLSHLFPPSWLSRPGAYPANLYYLSDEIGASSYIFAGLVYLGMLIWIWSRQRRNRLLWLGAVMTVGIGLATLGLCLLVDKMFQGDDEFLILGTASAGGGLLLLAWIRLYRRYAGGRALYDENGVIDLRCPACQYRMVGLKQSRCPECGQEYTLDELVSRQDFEVLRLRRAFLGSGEESSDRPVSLLPTSADDAN